MPNLKFNGFVAKIETGVTFGDWLKEHDKELFNKAIAIKYNNKAVDLFSLPDSDGEFEVIVQGDEEGLSILRHSTAHLMAQAVKRLFPEAKVTIGPSIENGFYYDFAYEKSFTPEDLDKIQAQMEKLATQNFTVTRVIMSRDEATEFFRAQGEEYKAKLIDAIPTNEPLSLYKQGEFTDLCRGPHVPSTGKLKAFKLMKLAGAYWRGDSNNEMLQRIYGTAWANKKDLKVYLHRLEEAEKRDHRKLGKHLDLFHVQEEAPGMVFWHDKGWIIYLQVQDYIRRLLRQHGYQEVNTPQLVDRSLWEKSGHWDKFGDMIFSTHS